VTGDFVLYRILGNDLPPRHGSGQTIANLKFLLNHEPALAECEKRWVVNRIFDAAAEAEIIRLLEAHGQPYLHLPFDHDTYAERFLDATGLLPGFNPFATAFASWKPTQRLRALDWLHRHKTLCAMNVNGARNAAIEEGRTLARWTLPWDGACFVTAAGWEPIRRAAASAEEARYLTVPTARMATNEILLDPSHAPEADEEPQIVFRADARERFDKKLRYGMNDKADLLCRLDVPGPWHEWRKKLPPWDRRIDGYSPDKGLYVSAGWVARLSAHTSEAVERDDHSRWVARFHAIIQFCQMTDKSVLDRRFSAEAPLCYLGLPQASVIPTGHSNLVIQQADDALTLAPLSVTHKPSPPPGGDKRDYFTVADDGQAIRHDGVRKPEAILYSPESAAHDRTRFQRLVDACVALALAHRLTGERRYADHAATLLRTWFFDPATAMSPHVRHAQRRRDQPDSASPHGIVEFRDLWPLLDAIRILAGSGALNDSDLAGLRSWFSRFLDYLLNNPQGQAAIRMQDHIGTWCDLVIAAIAAFVSETAVLSTVLNLAPVRFADQFDAACAQPRELARARPAHYTLFNLQAWVNLASLGRAIGIDLWRYSDSTPRSLCRAIRHAADTIAQLSDYAAGPETLQRRLAALAAAAPPDAADADLIKSLFLAHGPEPLAHPDTGIPPFWALFGLRH